MSNLTSHVTFDRQNHATTATVRGTVPPMPFRDLARLCDPQMWRCGPYFPETFKVTCVRGAYTRDPSPPEAGTSWSGQLWEHFECSVASMIITKFINILNIDYRVQGNDIRLTYSLHRPLHGSAWFSPVPIGLDMDFGHMRVSTTPVGFDVQATKTVRFVELVGSKRVFSECLNRVAPFVLGYWMRSLLRLAREV